MKEPSYEIMPTIAPPPRVNVLGVGVHAVNPGTAIELMESAIVGRRRGYVCVTNVHVVIEAQDDPQLKEVLNRSFLTVPDGRPAVWVGRLQGFRRMDQVGGPDLMLTLCALSSRRGYTHFFYGGQPGVAEELSREMAERFPGLRISGTYTPPFRPLSPREEEELSELLARLKPDVMWVGLGAPKQELFMGRYLDRFQTTLMVGVGAAFDMHTGRINDAPRWMKRAGLAWLHRLAQEPRRLWSRYLTTIPRFLWHITLQLLGIRKHHLNAPAAGQISSTEAIET